MKTYKVMICYKVVSQFDVEARSEEEAIEMAEEMYENGDDPDEYNEYPLEPEVDQ